MAIVAVIMSVNFAACSDDDDEGEGKISIREASGTLGINL